MEFAIIILVALAMIIIAKKGGHTKAREQSNYASKSEKNITLNERQRKQKEIDELITVVLPTINNNK